MSAVAPPRVRDIEENWGTLPPPEPSPRCLWWVNRIAAGWRPNRRIKIMGYYEASAYYGVWIWEYLDILRPALDAALRSTCPRVVT